MSDTDTAGYVQQIVAAVPELQPVLQEHLDDNFEELLPHVFFGEVTRWAEANASDSDAVARLLAQLEQGLENGSPEVQELITASFLENLEDDSPLLGQLPDALRRQRQ